MNTKYHIKVLSGHTLVEVITAFAIGTIVLGVMYMGYLTIVRTWSSYSHQQHADNLAWIVYNKVHSLFRDNMEIICSEQQKWLFINSENDSTIIECKDSKLVIDNKPIILDGYLKDFTIVKSDRVGRYPVWESSQTCVYKDKSSGLRYFSVCLENSISKDLPSIDSNTVSLELYWDTKE